jgi:hypothetical protein
MGKHITNKRINTINGHSDVAFSFLIHCSTGFLEFQCLCFLMPEVLCSLVLGLLKEPTDCVPKVTAGSLPCCSPDSLVDTVLGDAAGCFTCFLEFHALCFLLPVRVCAPMFGRVVEPLECVSGAPVGSVCGCSADSLAKVLAADAAVWGRNIPGTTTRFFLGSIKPLLSCCSLNMASNFCLLTFSESDSRSFWLSSTSISSKFWNQKKKVCKFPGTWYNWTSNYWS